MLTNLTTGQRWFMITGLFLVAFVVGGSDIADLIRGYEYNAFGAGLFLVLTGKAIWMIVWGKNTDNEEPSEDEPEEDVTAFH